MHHISGILFLSETSWLETPCLLVHFMSLMCLPNQPFPDSLDMFPTQVSWHRPVQFLSLPATCSDVNLYDSDQLVCKELEMTTIQNFGVYLFGNVQKCSPNVPCLQLIWEILGRLFVVSKVSHKRYLDRSEE